LFGLSIPLRFDLHRLSTEYGHDLFSLLLLYHFWLIFLDFGALLHTMYRFAGITFCIFLRFAFIVSVNPILIAY
jgi:hypothetical protein